MQQVILWIFVQNCIFDCFLVCSTMPKCISHAVHILIGCSEDDNGEIQNLSRETLKDLSTKLSSELSGPLIENLEEKFYSVVSTLPRIFNRKGNKAC